MDLQPKANDIHKLLQQLEVKAHNHFHRYLVVISGDERWVRDVLSEQLSKLSEQDTLIVSDQYLEFSKACSVNKCIEAKHVKRYLGSEVERLVWNGFSGLNPDALGAATGLIRGGGILFLMLPKFSHLNAQPDPDYLRMCREPDELKGFGTRFLQRLMMLIESDNDILLFQQDTLAPTFKTLDLSAASQLNLSKQTADQLCVIEHILHVSNGHRKRPLVIYADRGRGKSSALGLAAAKISAKVLITAPNRRACDAAFKHYDSELASKQINSAQSLEFIAPDELIATQAECHILFVDEAAAIPTPLLKQILEIYPRVVFSSTIHGYEGTGQGFAVRFKQVLDVLTPQWKSFTLNTPVRWSDNDPLERWIFKFLLLNAQTPELTAIKGGQVKSSVVSWLTQEQLTQNEGILTQVTALLVTAHYQTSPSDIRMILDHPNLYLGLIQIQHNIVGVVLILEEGGLNSPQLAQNIIEGTRRPKGHLVSQALTSSTTNTKFLSHKTYRVMRIAVHPDLNCQGLGSKLIDAAVKLGQQNKIDYLSASFGFTPLLLDFWRKNNFQLLRVGYHKDAASGAQAVIVTRGLNKQIEQDLSEAQIQFQQHFIFGLNNIYRVLDVEIVFGTLSMLKSTEVKLSTDTIQIVKLYAEQHRSFEDCVYMLFHFVLDGFSKGFIQLLQKQEQKLLCMRILQGRSVLHCVKSHQLRGKKQLEQVMKKAIVRLLDNY